MDERLELKETLKVWTDALKSNDFLHGKKITMPDLMVYGVLHAIEGGLCSAMNTHSHPIDTHRYFYMTYPLTTDTRTTLPLPTHPLMTHTLSLKSSFVGLQTFHVIMDENALLKAWFYRVQQQMPYGKPTKP